MRSPEDRDDGVLAGEHREFRMEEACPGCGGPLDARATAQGLWTWCATCRLLAHPQLRMGANGPMLVHRQAAA